MTFTTELLFASIDGVDLSCHDHQKPMKACQSFNQDTNTTEELVLCENAKTHSKYIKLRNMSNAQLSNSLSLSGSLYADKNKNQYFISYNSISKKRIIVHFTNDGDEAYFKTYRENELITSQTLVCQ